MSDHMESDLTACRPYLLSNANLVALMRNQCSGQSYNGFLESMTNATREEVNKCLEHELKPEKHTLLGGLLRVSVGFQARMELQRRAGDAGFSLGHYIERHTHADENIQDCGEGDMANDGPDQDRWEDEEERYVQVEDDDVTGEQAEFQNELKEATVALDRMIKDIRPSATEKMVTLIKEKMVGIFIVLGENEESRKSFLYDEFWTLERRVRTRRGSRGGKRLREKNSRSISETQVLSKAQRRRIRKKTAKKRKSRA